MFFKCVFEQVFDECFGGGLGKSTFILRFHSTSFHSPRPRCLFYNMCASVVDLSSSESEVGSVVSVSSTTPNDFDAWEVKQEINSGPDDAAFNCREPGSFDCR